MSSGGLLDDVETIILWRRSYPMFGAAIEAGLIFSEEWWTEEGKRNLHNPAYDIERWCSVMCEQFGRVE